ncbi:heparinase II/III family protein [Parabacteroides leei]|uniref:heparinase II/III family protein n=1 Tax=Parabacteroides leei TaxID=2939491 RepID=UPI003242AFEE
MDYLLQTGLDPKLGIDWINRFIQDQSTNITGLDPYPIALRNINWIKFISRYYFLISETELTQWNTSIYSQYQRLFSNLEFHLLGNHLLENAYSLLWGGLYFREDKFYEKAVWLLTQELNEQILPDGAHYELSPMYHEILLDRLLDCINALKYNYRFEGQESVIAFLEEKARLMLSWLNAIIYKDGTIPLLNDSAYGIAPSARDLFAYAKRLAIQWSTHKLKESGYRKFVSDTFEMIMDVGNIGPDYIPGHAQL